MKSQIRIIKKRDESQKSVEETSIKKQSSASTDIAEQVRATVSAWIGEHRLRQHSEEERARRMVLDSTLLPHPSAA